MVLEIISSSKFFMKGINYSYILKDLKYVFKINSFVNDELFFYLKNLICLSFNFELNYYNLIQNICYV